MLLQLLDKIQHGRSTGDNAEAKLLAHDLLHSPASPAPQQSQRIITPDLSRSASSLGERVQGVLIVELPAASPASVIQSRAAKQITIIAGTISRSLATLHLSSPRRKILHPAASDWAPSTLAAQRERTRTALQESHTESNQHVRSNDRCAAMLCCERRAHLCHTDRTALRWHRCCGREGSRLPLLWAAPSEPGAYHPQRLFTNLR